MRPYVVHRRDIDSDRADEQLVRDLRDQRPSAMAALMDRYGPHVHRILLRVMGQDQELEDLMHEVFMDAWRDVPRLRDGVKLKPWLTRMAVNIGRDCIRRRMRRKWLLFFAPADVPDMAGPSDNHDEREELRCAYRVLDGMPVDLRTAFVLRFIEELELTEVADACGVSLATIKRRLQKAELDFGERARAVPALAPWIRRAEGGLP